MIYFFDNELNMVKVATSKNVTSAVHEHELNGLILGTVETDLSYTEAFINDVDYFGYYYKDNYHLHKIKRVEHEHENELVRITGRHIFFEDMLYGDYIRDVRPVNRDALYILNQTISANTRWQTVMTDTSKLHSETYYWVPPMEVLNDLTENAGIEYEPKILFDGQKINGFQLHVANRIGEDTPIRVPFGSRVLNLKYEVDYSEIVTALYGHGKGEEVGDGYGRRINFSSVNFSRNGVVSPADQLYMENPNVTAQYGKDDGSPKFGRIIFEDIESASELANATYEAYLEQSRPKMLFEASVVDLGDVGMGDGVLIIRREYDVYFNARIHKLMVDLLDVENADVELGDYAHFKESKVQRKTRESNNQYRRETSSRIQQLKEQFNDRFDGEVNQMREDFEQALIDAHAEIQAAEQRMQELLDTERAEFNERFETEMQAAYDEAERNYGIISDEITSSVDNARTEMTTAFEASVQAAEQRAEQEYLEIRDDITETVDSAREQMMSDFESQVSDTREFAQQQAELNANAVREDLSETTSQHNQMIEDLQADVIDFDEFRTDTNTHVQEIANRIGTIDDFLGDVSSITLDERLQRMNLDFIEEINNINLNTANMLQGTNFDEPDKVRLYSNTDLLDRGDYNVARIGRPGGNEGMNTSSYMMEEPVYLEANKDYFLYIEYRSFSTPELDYLTLSTGSGTFELYDADKRTEGFTDLTTDGSWRRAKIRINLNNAHEGQMRIGSRWNRGAAGVWIETRRPYLTDTNNDRWLPHPMDATQSIEQISRRITELEDGRLELITRSEYDFETEQITQTVKDIEETVDTSRQMIVDINNYDVIKNGSEVMQTVLGFEQKVWLNDVADIGANLIPQSSNAWEDGSYWAGGGTDNPDSTRIRLRRENAITVVKGETYTLSDSSNYWSRVSIIDMHQYEDGEHTGQSNWLPINRGETVTFQAAGNEILFAIRPPGAPDWTNINTSQMEDLEYPVQIKLEKGNTATPMMNALSRVEQLADRFSVRVEELDGNFVTHAQFDITADSVETLVSSVSDNETQIGNLVVEYDAISSTVATLDGELSSQGTWINQTDDLITSKVWMNDVADINANLIPFTDFTVSGNSDFWTRYGSNAFAVTNDGYYRARNTNSTGFISIETPSFDVVEGQEYTVSFKGYMSSNIGRTNFDRTYNLGAGVGSISAGIAYNQGDGVYRYRFTATGTGSQTVVIGVWTPSGRDVSIYIKEVKVEKGTVMTPYMQAMSVVEQMANEIRLAVQGIDGYGYLTQSDIQIRPGYVQLGSQRLGDDELASIIRVSPDTIDAIASEMRLSGDLLVEGEITALAVKAIEGEFASLWADEFEAITIKVGDIEGVTAEFERMYILNANIEKLVSQNVFTNAVTAKSIEAINGRFGSLFAAEFEAITIDVEDISGRTAWFEDMIVNRAVVDELVSDVHFSDEITSKAVNAINGRFGSLFTAELETVVLESKHIGSNTIKASMLDVDSAMINKLFADTILSDKITSISIESVYADLRKVDSEIMSANIIQSNWLDVDNALVERMYTKQAFIDNAEIKAANIRDLDAITINANQITLTTLRNRVNQIEGGLNIVRPDGATWVQNGVPRGNIPVQIFDSYSDDEVGFTGLNFYTQSSHWKTFKYFYTPHEGRTLRIVWAVGLYDGPSNIEYMEVRARNFSGYSPLNNGSGTSARRVTLNRGETTYITQDIPMNAPNYTLNAAYLEFRRAPDGQSSNNRVYARILHIGQYD